MATSMDDELPIVKLNFRGLTEDRRLLRPKSKSGWLYLYENFLSKADWFIKADDDTYVVMEHMKVSTG